jgi:hypothetical protein
MRSHRIIAIATVLAVGVGVKLFFFSGPAAEANADAVKSSSMDVFPMHVNANLSEEKIIDMTFVFYTGESSAGIVHPSR